MKMHKNLRMIKGMPKEHISMLLLAVLIGFLSAQAIFLESLAFAEESGKELLKSGIDLYKKADFDEAILNLRKALDLGLNTEEKVEAYKYLAFCYLAKAQMEEVKAELQQLLKLQPDYQLREEVSPKVRDAFEKAKDAFEKAKAEKPPRGAIFIKSIPEGALISLDGILQPSRTSTTLNGVSVGKHSLKLSLDGYADWNNDSILVRAGETTNVEAFLKTIGKPPRNGESATKRGSKKWLWATLGGAAVTGGVTAAIALARRSEDRTETGTLVVKW